MQPIENLCKKTTTAWRYHQCTTTSAVLPPKRRGIQAKTNENHYKGFKQEHEYSYPPMTETEEFRKNNSVPQWKSTMSLNASPTKLLATHMMLPPPA